MDLNTLFSRTQLVLAALTRTQLATLAATFLAVIGLVIGSAFWLAAPTYRVLFTDLDVESAREVMTRLDTEKVKYQLDEGGRTVRVPQEQVDRLRIDLAPAISSGRAGYELFDRTAFGQTEFLEQVNYRRALEGELARSIATITEVAAARVHIAMARESLFGSRQQPAKASVVLKLRSNRSLSTDAVTGITSLMAASVEGLRPDAVVILDSYGRPLTHPQEEDGAPIAAEQLERQARYERDVTERIVALLEPVVGIGHVRVNVSARLNQASQEQTEELYDQTNPKAGTPASKVVRVTSTPSGELARVSVAVLLDDQQLTSTRPDGSMERSTRGRDPAEIQKIQQLVATAVGLDSARGDRLTVENITFDESVEEPSQPRFAERYGPQMLDVGKVLAVLAIGLTALFLFVRPIINETLRQGLAASTRPDRAVAAHESSARRESEVRTWLQAEEPHTGDLRLSVERANPQQLSSFLQHEHPQTIAVILAYQQPRQAAALLSSLPDALRVDVLMRLAGLDAISSEVIDRVSKVLEERLKTMGVHDRGSAGGVRAVADLLDALDRNVGHSTLEALDGVSPGLAISIRKHLAAKRDGEAYVA